jgi:hypothetical protein
MKSFIILVAMLLGGVALVGAQDVITLKNGEEVKAKVQEVGLSDVKYRRYENLDGPVYTLRKTEIFMIKYENGEKDVFKDEAVAPPVAREGLASTESQKGAMGLLVGKVPKKSLNIANVKFENEYGEKLSKEEVRSALVDTPAAWELYKSGRQLNTAAWVFFGVGAGCVTVGGAMMDWDKPETIGMATPVACVGLGCCVVSIVLGVSGNAKLKSAYNIYRSGKDGAGSSLNFGVTSSGGIGLTYRF